MQHPASSSMSSTRNWRELVQARMWLLGSLLVAGSAAFVFSLSAWAGPGGAEHGSRHSGGHHAMHMMGGYHGGFPLGLWGGRHAERVLDRIEATPAQREQIRQIVERAKTDLHAQHQEGRALHEQGLKLWAQPQIDTAAAERLRQQMLAHHDKASQKMLGYMIEIGNVLTPAQRAKLADDMQKRHARKMERRAAAQAASAASHPAPRK